jgi:hypothetical protein
MGIWAATIRRRRRRSSSGIRPLRRPPNDRLLYVCDRVNDRLQVFKPDGTFVKEAFFNKQTLGSGSVWDIAFSRDPQQRFLYLADGENDKVHVILRETLEILTSFGEGGRQPGAFYGVHSIATDSKGNVYTTETYRGQRVQKIVYKGMAPVTKRTRAWCGPTVGRNAQGGRTVPSPIARRQGDRGAAVGHYASVRGTRHPGHLRGGRAAVRRDRGRRRKGGGPAVGRSLCGVRAPAIVTDRRALIRDHVP